ncbi:DUF998 domain-containing protein [Microbacterium azadirachtae]|uniref:DUF998 domain-containing protein n=1 Tax=Microbacterium azadirachtae TaxID=582680 RepID=UPI000881C259|nr:DUF998 domain-containing protein [Microbacterium azadirachtae]UXW86810.1 DUF998 domain-containing protein [Microbacterium azadirachtae]SDM35605.1 hypothetical membrane protein [Microbacterium azadirachtae]SEG52744.1 hypothetical membrane protein [Microbacterium azadirachtae]SEG55742.1 hypothetical membrane protein [Microbacterium azadirachtae]
MRSEWDRLIRRLREARAAATLHQMRETDALLTGAIAFVLGFLVASVVFWNRTLSITGAWSVGEVAAYGGAAVALLSFLAGRIGLRLEAVEAPEKRDPDAANDGFAAPGQRLRWYELIAIALAHAAVALLAWFGLAALLEAGFRDAPVFPFPGAVLVAVALALTGYVCYLSAIALSPTSISLILAVYLVIGALTAMLEASDPHWWRDNLSALGMSSNASSPAFNGTLIVAGVMVTTIARYATAALPVPEPRDERGRTIVRVGLILIGVLLALVGIFPVDRFFLLHNTVATGMAVCFAGVVIALPWLLRRISRVFVVLGWVYVLVIALLGVFFATGYYNLTAVELIAAVLIFSWIIVFLRTAGADHGAWDADRDRHGEAAART